MPVAVDMREINNPDMIAPYMHIKSEMVDLALIMSKRTCMYDYSTMGLVDCIRVRDIQAMLHLADEKNLSGPEFIMCSKCQTVYRKEGTDKWKLCPVCGKEINQDKL